MRSAALGAILDAANYDTLPNGSDEEVIERLLDFADELSNAAREILYLSEVPVRVHVSELVR